jgi:hypothetical protein
MHKASVPKTAKKNMNCVWFDGIPYLPYEPWWL